MRAALAVALLLALAGCVSGGSPVGTTPTETTTPVETPTTLTPTPNGTHVVCGGYPARDMANLSCSVVNGSGYVSPTGFNRTGT